MYNKYHQVHGHDVANFDLESINRRPTVSAADVLTQLEDEASPAFIPTGLPSLDKQLAGIKQEEWETHISGGLLKGQVTEVWGPPGSGKTTLGIQMTANAIADGDNVIWVDNFHPVSHERLISAYKFALRFHDQCGKPDAEAVVVEAEAGPSSAQRGIEASPKQEPHPLRHNLQYFRCPSLAHFVALVCYPAPNFIRPKTTLLVIDSLSALVNYTYPRAPYIPRKAKGQQGGGHRAPPPPASISRRPQALQFISTSLEKLATKHNIAVLVLSQCATQISKELGAIVIPSLNSPAWEQAMGTRLALLRDWIQDDGSSEKRSAYFVAPEKINGIIPTQPALVAFKISTDCMSEIPFDNSEPAGRESLEMTLRKRKRDAAGLEIPDSDVESFGEYDDVEEHLLASTISAMPAGSEDQLGMPVKENSPMDDSDPPQADLERLNQEVAGGVPSP